MTNPDSDERKQAPKAPRIGQLGPDDSQLVIRHDGGRLFLLNSMYLVPAATPEFTIPEEGPVDEATKEAWMQQFVNGYFTHADARGRTEVDSDQKLHNRERALSDIGRMATQVANIGRFPGTQHEPTQDDMLIAAGIVALMPKEAQPVQSGSPTHHQADRDIAVLNDFLKDKPFGPWILLQHEGRLGQTTAVQWMGLVNRVYGRKVFSEPLIQGASGKIGRLPKGARIATPSVFEQLIFDEA